MDYEQYRTKKGDTWDMLSLLFYGNEYFMLDLVKANPEHRKTIIFEEGIILKVPVIENEEAEDVPDWMEEDDLLEDDGLDGEVEEDDSIQREDW